MPQIRTPKYENASDWVRLFQEILNQPQKDPDPTPSKTKRVLRKTLGNLPEIIMNSGPKPGNLILNSPHPPARKSSEKRALNITLQDPSSIKPIRSLPTNQIDNIVIYGNAPIPNSFEAQKTLALQKSPQTHSMNKNPFTFPEPNKKAYYNLSKSQNNLPKAKNKVCIPLDSSHRSRLGFGKGARMGSTGNLKYLDNQEDLGPFMVKMNNPTKTSSPFKKNGVELKGGGHRGGLSKKRMSDFFSKNPEIFGSHVLRKNDGVQLGRSVAGVANYDLQGSLYEIAPIVAN
jgi:hypothetical protein